MEKKSLAPVAPAQADIELSVSPQDVLARASEMARALVEVVSKASGLEVTIAGRRYLRVEAWMTVAAFHGATVTVDQVTSMPDGKGYVARASVHWRDGRVVSAESSCSRDEPAWRDRPDYALRSMAQTRAAAKALRIAFAYIPVLAGFAPTPAEEVEEESPRSRPQSQPQSRPQPRAQAQPQARPQPERESRPQPAARPGGKGNALSEFREAMAQEGWPETRARELWAVLWPEAQRWSELSPSQQALLAEAARDLIRLVRDRGPEGARRLVEELLPPGDLVSAQQIAQLARAQTVLEPGEPEAEP